jgi:hypothetical protein
VEGLLEQVKIFKNKAKEFENLYNDAEKKHKQFRDRADDDGLVAMRRIKKAEDRVFVILCITSHI